MTPARDTAMMRRAIRLAVRARGRTAPNPPVGAVVVADGQIVGSGYHRGPGLPHAEVEALREAGSRANGATLYVTLAPCSTVGRTPACTPEVITSGVARVVIGAPDPNPREGEGSVPLLTAAGISVTQGVALPETTELISGFAHWITTGTPLVTVKLAVTLDGRVAAADGSSQWITGPSARRDAHRLRSYSGAVIVGIGTVLADDPRLTVRLRGFDGPQPLRVVLDSCARTPLGAHVLDGGAPACVAVSSKAPEDALAQIRATGAEVLRAATHEGRVDASDVLAELGRRGITDVLVEGGPSVAGDLIERKLADRFVFYVAPRLLGSLGTPAIAGLMIPTIGDALDLQFTRVTRTGADIRIDAKLRG